MPVLENDALKITVADRGAEPVSVWDKENGCERLWTAEPAVWNRHGREGILHADPARLCP